MEVRGAVLAIGTELTEGQITNRNAQWISQKLTQLGIKITEHRVVPDDRNLIFGALRDFETRGRDFRPQVLILTGGLGPTVDDFTREVVADWCLRSLVFDPDSWRAIEESFQLRGIPATPNNRRQCYFPAGSTLLLNPHGTARGFFFEKDGCLVCVLPGPPRESFPMWENELHPVLSARFPSIRPRTLKKWSCLGVGESKLASLIEPLLAPAWTEKGVELGFRAHVPWVEVKLWIPHDFVRNSEIQALCEAIERVCVPWLGARDDEDPATIWARALEDALPEATILKFQIFPKSFSQNFSERILPLLSSSTKLNGVQFEYTEALTEAKNFTFHLRIRFPKEENVDRAQLEIALYVPREDLNSTVSAGLSSSVEIPYRYTQMTERAHAYAVERALLEMTELLRNRSRV